MKIFFHSILTFNDSIDNPNIFKVTSYQSPNRHHLNLQRFCFVLDMIGFIYTLQITKPNKNIFTYVALKAFFGGFKLSVRCRIAFICVLDGWRLDLLSAAYTSNWWPGERNFVV